MIFHTKKQMKNELVARPVSVYGRLDGAEVWGHPVVGYHHAVRNSEHPKGLSTGMVVENVLVRFVEFANHIEDSLSDLKIKNP